VASRAYGSWLLGGPDQSLTTAMRRARWLTTVALVVANLAGAAGTFVLAAFVLPTPRLEDDHDLLVTNLVMAAIFFVVTAVLASLWGAASTRRRTRWAYEERTPTPKEQRATLRTPALMTDIQIVFWGLAAALFGTLNGLRDIGLGLSITLAIAIGGAITAGNAYLLSEFAMRPVSAHALSSGPPTVRLFLPGLRTRALVAWVLGSAVPVLGLMAIAVATLAGTRTTPTKLAVSTLSLGGTVLVFGLFLLRLASRATADPVRSVRAALARVEAGDLDVAIPVYDASEVGQLQAGFNRMTAGLREREQLRDLFGRHVGDDVARAALEGGVELGGEVRDVGILFVDLVGSTELAATRPPTEVVELLNTYFEVVVEVVTAYGGLVNQLQGDAALAVFGAPVSHDDPAGAALRAATELVARLAMELPGCAVGVGVSFGPAVAGNIGAESRYAYTVIGDAVNEAARLTDLAKGVPGGVAASRTAVDKAVEPGSWELRESVVLRGRSLATDVMTPSLSER
jgi:adenylate cyclase